MLYKQGNTSYPIPFFMISTSGTVPYTGSVPTVTISKNGGAFGAAVGAVTSLGNGWFTLAANGTDFNTLGALAIHASVTGAFNADEKHQVVAFDPQDSVRQGMTALPSVAAGAAGGLATATNASGQVVASNVLTDVATALTAAGLILARMQLLDAAACTATIAGNVETMHTLDGAHVFTATYDNISNPTSVTVAQVS